MDGQKHSIWIARADGSQARRLIAKGSQGTVSADGRWVAYEDPRVLTVYIRRVAQGPSRRLGDGVYAWSPRGALLALSDRKTVQLLDPATGGRRTVVRGRDLIVESFSPDGRALVYTHQTTRGSDADLRSDIYTVRLSDRRIRRLTHDGRSGEPVWGRGWIAYRHYSRTKWPQIGGLWFMHADGGQKHLFARGDQNPRRAHYGLGAVKFSRDGARLLACTVAEFGCSPVTIFVGSRRQHVFSLHEFPRLRGEGPSLYPGGLSKNGREVMIDIGPFDGDSGHRVYVVPFGGGRPRLLLRDGTSPSWAE